MIRQRENIYLTTISGIGIALFYRPSFQMKKFFLFLLLTILFKTADSQTTGNQRYFLISESKYSQRLNKEKDVLFKRYIIVPDEVQDKNLLFRTGNPDSLFLGAVSLLMNGKSSKVQVYLKTCNMEVPVNHLIAGLFHVLKGDFQQADQDLALYQGVAFVFIKNLLRADCRAELLQGGKDLKPIIQEYQVALDCTENENYRDLIRNRIKYLRYR